MNQPITKEQPFGICFVCLGNICRSPTAEGIFRHLVHEQGFDPYFLIDSAGTSAFHIGEPANSKSQMTARRHGVTLRSRARRFDAGDFGEFDLILAMDKENLDALNELDRSRRYGNKIRLMREFDPEPGDGNVPDPYYGGIDGFENVYRIVYRSCDNLLEKLKPKIEP